MVIIEALALVGAIVVFTLIVLGILKALETLNTKDTDNG